MNDKKQHEIVTNDPLRLPLDKTLSNLPNHYIDIHTKYNNCTREGREISPDAGNEREREENVLISSSQVGQIES